jgi:hypothetical protein
MTPFRFAGEQMPGHLRLTRTFPDIKIFIEVIMKNVINKTVGTILVGSAIILAAGFALGIPFNFFM